MIDLIGNYIGLNITQLAEKYGVTKSAVSKHISRLSKKGLVEKYKLIDNKKEVFIRLTPLGRVAFDGHIEFHKIQEAEYVVKFNNLNQRDKDLILDFLDSYSKCIGEYKY